MKQAAGILIIAEDTGRTLLLLRSLEGGSPAVWSIPGGRLEPGETDEEAALRETREETGYDGPWSHPLNYRFVRDGYVTFFAHVPEEFAVDLNGEHDDAGWFELDDLPVPAHRGVHQALQLLRAHA